jgi:hypothetical protein
MSKILCSTCRISLKHEYQCGLCQNIFCKDCVQFLDSSFFSFLKDPPPETKHEVYCAACYDQKVAPMAESYSETMNRAKEVYIFEKKEKYIPLISSSKHKIRVEDCPDRKETMLRLAFMAAEGNYNAVIDVDLVAKKVRVNGYQSTSWSGTGNPAMIRKESLREQD